MISIPSDLSTLTKQQLQELIGSCAQDIEKIQGVDYISAWRQAKTQYAPVFAELQKRNDQETQSRTVPTSALSNEDKARISLLTPTADNLNRLGLHPTQTSLDEYQTCAKACGDISDPDHVKAMDALVDATSRARCVSSAAARSSVAMRHPNLARLSATQSFKEKLQSELPEPGGGFSGRTGYHAPTNVPSNAKSSPPPANPFLPKAALGNDSFTGASVLANSREPFTMLGQMGPGGSYGIIDIR